MTISRLERFFSSQTCYRAGNFFTHPWVSCKTTPTKIASTILSVLANVFTFGGCYIFFHCNERKWKKKDPTSLNNDDRKTSCIVQDVLPQHIPEQPSTQPEASDNLKTATQLTQNEDIFKRVDKCIAQGDKKLSLIIVQGLSESIADQQYAATRFVEHWEKDEPYVMSILDRLPLSLTSGVLERTVPLLQKPFTEKLAREGCPNQKADDVLYFLRRYPEQQEIILASTIRKKIELQDAKEAFTLVRFIHDSQLKQELVLQIITLCEATGAVQEVLRALDPQSSSSLGGDPRLNDAKTKLIKRYCKELDEKSTEEIVECIRKDFPQQEYTKEIYKQLSAQFSRNRSLQEAIVLVQNIQDSSFKWGLLHDFGRWLYNPSDSLEDRKTQISRMREVLRYLDQERAPQAESLRAVIFQFYLECHMRKEALEVLNGFTSASNWLKRNAVACLIRAHIKAGEFEEANALLPIWKSPEISGSTYEFLTEFSLGYLQTKQKEKALELLQPVPLATALETWTSMIAWCIDNSNDTLAKELIEFIPWEKASDKAYDLIAAITKAFQNRQNDSATPENIGTLVENVCPKNAPEWLKACFKGAINRLTHPT